MTDLETIETEANGARAQCDHAAKIVSGSETAASVEGLGGAFLLIARLARHIRITHESRTATDGERIKMLTAERDALEKERDSLRSACADALAIIAADEPTRALLDPTNTRSGTSTADLARAVVAERDTLRAQLAQRHAEATAAMFGPKGSKGPWDHITWDHTIHGIRALRVDSDALPALRAQLAEVTEQRDELASRLDDVAKLVDGSWQCLRGKVQEVIDDRDEALTAVAELQAQLASRKAPEVTVSVGLRGLAYTVSMGSLVVHSFCGDGRAEDAEALQRKLTEWLAAHWPAPGGEKRTAKCDEVAKGVLTVLYLYPHHRVEARGPLGILTDILRRVHPEASKALDNGDAVDVLQRFFPDHAAPVEDGYCERVSRCPATPVEQPAEAQGAVGDFVRVEVASEGPFTYTARGSDPALASVYVGEWLTLYKIDRMRALQNGDALAREIESHVTTRTAALVAERDGANRRIEVLDAARQAILETNGKSTRELHQAIAKLKEKARKDQYAIEQSCRALEASEAEWKARAEKAEGERDAWKKRALDNVNFAFERGAREMRDRASAVCAREKELAKVHTAAKARDLAEQWGARASGAAGCELEIRALPLGKESDDAK